MPYRGWPSAALAVVLAIAVPVVPIGRTAASRCDVCAPSCPMHRTAKPACHHAAAASAKPGQHCGKAPGFARPGCGRGHETTASAVTFAVPAARAVVTPPSRIRVVHRTPLATAGRGADPPEPPPPIRFS